MRAVKTTKSPASLYIVYLIFLAYAVLGMNQFLIDRKVLTSFDSVLALDLSLTPVDPSLLKFIINYYW